VAQVVELQPSDHLELGLGGSGQLLLVGRLLRTAGDQLCGAESLELDGVGARGHGRVHQPAGDGHVAIVVHAGLGDDEGPYHCNLSPIRIRPGNSHSRTSTVVSRVLAVHDSFDLPTTMPGTQR
jgi:hypothetical protein